MNEIEQRIRAGLDVEVPVSPDAMLHAAAAGVRQYRRRRTGLVVTSAAATVALAIVVGVSLSETGSQPPPPKPIETPEKVSTPPSPGYQLDDLETDGTSLYLTAHRCPVAVIAGVCEAKDGYWDGKAPAPRKPYPVALWRYAEERWERLGVPGVNSYADLVAFPGGILFVPRDQEAARFTDGPVRISLDGGRTWESWKLPWKAEHCSAALDETCDVVVAGDYVVAASGRTWSRRHISSDEWEDISPPTRRAINDFDKLGWDVLALDDGTLIATANNILPSGEGLYRVSRDAGSTWGAPHDNPGQTSAGHGSFLDRVDGEAAYAECWELVPGYGGDSGRSCGYYRSTDLEHWTKFDEPLDLLPNICARPAGPTWRMTEVAERVGGVVYEIAAVHLVNGHEATRTELAHLDIPHRVRHVLEVSVNDCQTWEPVLE